MLRTQSSQSHFVILNLVDCFCRNLWFRAKCLVSHRISKGFWNKFRMTVKDKMAILYIALALLLWNGTLSVRSAKVGWSYVILREFTHEESNLSVVLSFFTLTPPLSRHQGEGEKKAGLLRLRLAMTMQTICRISKSDLLSYLSHFVILNLVDCFCRNLRFRAKCLVSHRISRRSWNEFRMTVKDKMAFLLALQVGLSAQQQYTKHPSEKIRRVLI